MNLGFVMGVVPYYVLNVMATLRLLNVLNVVGKVGKKENIKK